MTTKEMLKMQYARINEELEKACPGSKEYHDLLENWVEIHERLMAEDKADVDLEFKNIELEMKEREASKPFWKRPDINTAISAGVSIFGMTAMLNYEKIGNITSKVLSHIPKPRLWK